MRLILLLAAVSLAVAGLPEELYRDGRYFAAATEFRRRLWFDPAEPGLDRLRLGMSLAGSAEVERAAAALRAAAGQGDSLAPAAALALAGLYEREGRFAAARFELLDQLVFAPETPLRDELNADIGWLELRDDNLAGAADALDRAGRARVAEELRGIGRVRPRDPTVAMVLSTFVPGAGEFYAGRPLAGLVSLLVNGSAAAGVYLLARDDDWVSAAVVFSLLFLRFYNGSRRNAADFAEEFNRARRRQAVARLGADAGLAPDWFGRAERLSGLRFPAAGTASPPAGAPARPE